MANIFKELLMGRRMHCNRVAGAVADRWHLLKNLGDAVRNQLYREFSVLKQVRDEVIAENKFHTERKKGAECQIVKSISTDRYRARFTEVKQLYTDGQSILSIAKKFKMSRQTVKKYIGIHSLPKKYRYNQLDNHMGYVKERLLQEPSLQLRDLWYELQQQGYNGAYTTLSENLKKAGVMVGKNQRSFNFPDYQIYYGHLQKPVSCFSKMQMRFLLSKRIH